MSKSSDILNVFLSHYQTHVVVIVSWCHGGRRRGWCPPSPRLSYEMWKAKWGELLDLNEQNKKQKWWWGMRLLYMDWFLCFSNYNAISTWITIKTDSPTSTCQTHLQTLKKNEKIESISCIWSQNDSKHRVIIKPYPSFRLHKSIKLCLNLILIEKKSRRWSEDYVLV